MAMEIVVNGKSQVICGRIKRDGTPCRDHPMKGRQFCRKHGGRNPAGRANPNFKSGKYSKYLPKNLLALYNESFLLEDPYSLREEIAVLDARLMHVISHVKATDGGEIIKQLADIREGIERYIEPDDEDATPMTKDELSMFSSKLGVLLDDFANEKRRWYEIYDVIEARRRLVESEVKRDALAQKQISETQALVLVSALVDIVKKHVDDAATFRKISADIDALSSRSTGRFPTG